MEYLRTLIVKSLDIVVYTVKILLIYMLYDSNIVGEFVFVDAVGILLFSIFLFPFYNLFIKSRLIEGSLERVVPTFNFMLLLSSIIGFLSGYIWYGVLGGVYIVSKLLEMSTRIYSVEIVIEQRLKSYVLALVSSLPTILLFFKLDPFTVMTISNVVIVVMFMVLDRGIMRMMFTTPRVNVGVIVNELRMFFMNNMFNVISTNLFLVLVKYSFGNYWLYLFKIPMAIGNTFYSLVNQLLPVLVKHRKDKSNELKVVAVLLLPIPATYVVSPFVAELLKIDSVRVFTTLSTFWMIASVTKMFKDYLVQKIGMVVNSKLIDVSNILVATLFIASVFFFKSLVEVILFVILLNVVMIFILYKIASSHVFS